MVYNLARLHKPTLNLSAHALFCSRLSIASVAGKQHLSEVVCSARDDFSFKGKWRNDCSSATASHFAWNWATARWKSFGRFTRFLVTMLWASRRLRSGTNDLKAAAHRWRASHAPIVHQHAEMTRSLPSERCGDAGPSFDYPRNCGRGGLKHFFGTFHFDGRFGYEESVGEIRDKAADGGAKATSC